MVKGEFPQADKNLVARSLRRRAWLYAAMGLPARTNEQISTAEWADIVASTEIVKRGEAQGERWKRVILALGGAGGSATSKGLALRAWGEWYYGVDSLYWLERLEYGMRGQWRAEDAPDAWSWASQYEAALGALGHGNSVEGRVTAALFGEELTAETWQRITRPKWLVRWRKLAAWRKELDTLATELLRREWVVIGVASSGRQRHVTLTEKGRLSEHTRKQPLWGREPRTDARMTVFQQVRFERWCRILPIDIAQAQVKWEQADWIVRARDAGKSLDWCGEQLGRSSASVRTKEKVHRRRLFKGLERSPAEMYLAPLERLNVGADLDQWIKSERLRMRRENRTLGAEARRAVLAAQT